MGQMIMPMYDAAVLIWDVAETTVVAETGDAMMT